MTFAFDSGGTITKHPEALWTIMECLRLGGHRVVVLTAIGTSDGSAEAQSEARGILKQLGFDFSKFEVVTLAEDFTGNKKGDWCQRNGACLLVDDATYNMDGLQRRSPQTARLLVL